MGSSVSHGNPKYRPFGIESGSQADPLEELHITLYLENCGFAELQSPGLCGFVLFFQFRNSLLEPKSPHLPRSNSYGLGFRVYGLPRPTQTAAQQRCRSLLPFGAFCKQTPRYAHSAFDCLTLVFGVRTATMPQRRRPARHLFPSLCF